MATAAALRPRTGAGLLFLLSVAVLALVALAAVFGPLLVPYDPTEFITDDPFAAPDRATWLGSDYMGRDMLSRMLYGTRLTMTMALGATLLAHLIGVSLGMVAALAGGVADQLLSRLVDVLLSLPKIVVGLGLVAALGPSIPVIMGVAAVVYAAGVFRIARALGMDLVSQDFVRVARARGEGLAWVLGAEMLPHMLRPLAADFAIRTSFAILFLSSLSFLGLGVQPPYADWGGLVRENLPGLSAGSFAPFYPALAIALVSIALNLCVDALGAGRARR